MILFCCASELGLPEDLSAIEVILYYYHYRPYVRRALDLAFPIVLIIKFQSCNDIQMLACNVNHHWSGMFASS